MKRTCFGIVLLLLSVSVFAQHGGDLCWGWDDRKPPELKEAMFRQLVEDNRVESIYICGQPIGLTQPLVVDKPVRIEGVGGLAVIFAKNKLPDSAAMLKFTKNASGSSMYKVEIDGNFHATKGIEVEGADSFSIHRSTLRNFIGTDFKYGAVDAYSDIYPARAIQITNGKRINIIDNIIENIGGHDTSSDRYFNGVDLVREGRLAHRGISIVGSVSGQVDIIYNTINDVYGYLDSSAVYVQSIGCGVPCYEGMISNNEISSFGKTAINLINNGFSVQSNHITSMGMSNQVGSRTIGTTSSAIFSLCTGLQCNDNIINRNIIELQRAYRGIQAIGEHYVGGNQVTIHSPYITARGMLTYEFSLQVSSGLSHFSGNRIYGEAKNPHLGATNYADGYCINSVSHTYRSEVYHDCDPVLPSAVLLRH
ncbi:hypothetical protein L1077_20495 [Pseudoalteromonas luteoviolacea]|uniref:hypothetical protein n=1 Tax=Pseudoalteromonas luteoviolacea TaxID=43657 RepID=UPI001F29E975|nr:hypothetical protein [Pseudoalteromonas luteoviolacea]MCF6441820.1 hypothetical protein [Pseudoalteromonas luteoviolacea]